VLGVSACECERARTWTGRASRSSCEPWTSSPKSLLGHKARLLRRWIDPSNRPARDALVLGITSFLLPPAFAIGLWASLNDVELAAWAVMLYLISLVAAICACRFGVEVRTLAKMGAPGRVDA